MRSLLLLVQVSLLAILIASCDLDWARTPCGDLEKDFQMPSCTLDVEANLMVYEATIKMIDSPYYKGILPLKIKAYCGPMLNHGMGLGPVYVHEYPEWTTVFSYEVPGAILAGIPQAACVLDSREDLVAVSRITRMGRGEFEMMEIHFGPTGTVVFRAESKFSLFFKKSERVICGEKSKEYFFMWPHGV